MTTAAQRDADRRAANLRRSLAEDFKRLRVDAGLTRAAVARAAGVHPSLISMIEDGDVRPTLETYVRISAALGADLAARVYPNAGPALRDRHQVRMAELLLSTVHPRWTPYPEVPVRRPAKGWIDVVLRDAREAELVATELESDIRRVEQVIRWSREKAESLPSAPEWSRWAGNGESSIGRLLIVRWTRANRDAADAARRQLREAFPADPRDALEALGTAPARWPGPAMLWARLDADPPRLVAVP